MRKYAWIYVIAAIVIAIWVGQYFLHQPVETQVAQAVDFEEKISTSGFLIRNETVYTASSSGSVENNVPSGTRVSKNTRIATIYTAGLDTQTKDELRTINDKIAKLESATSQGQLFSNDLSTVESQLRSGIKEIIDISQSGNMTNLEVVKTGVTQLISRHQEISGQGSPRDEALSTLYSQREQIEQRIDSAKEDILAGFGGIFISSTDGYEQTLTPAGIENLTVTGLKQLAVPQVVGDRETVQAGDAVCKMVDNSKWMCAAVVSEKDVYNLESGDSVQLRFPEKSDNAFPGTVEMISPVENGEVVIVISAGQYLDGIYTDRTANFEIIRRSYSGIEIPTSALRVDGEETGVFVDDEGVARFREVKVLYSNADITIVEKGETAGAIKMYDQVITNGKDIEDGRILY